MLTDVAGQVSSSAMRASNKGCYRTRLTIAMYIKLQEAGTWLNAETDIAGRVRVQKDLTVPGHPEILVVGETASLAPIYSPYG